MISKLTGNMMVRSMLPGFLDKGTRYLIGTTSSGLTIILPLHDESFSLMDGGPQYAITEAVIVCQQKGFGRLVVPSALTASEFLSFGRSLQPSDVRYE